MSQTRTNTHTVETSPGACLTHEQAAEVHAIRRLIERYPHIATPETAPELMMEHLAMLLCGQSEHRITETHKHHKGNEIHRIWWDGHEIYLSYDPKIMRIVTYLPRARSTERLKATCRRERRRSLP